MTLVQFWISVIPIHTKLSNKTIKRKVTKSTLTSTLCSSCLPHCLPLEAISSTENRRSSQQLWIRTVHPRTQDEWVFIRRWGLCTWPTMSTIFFSERTAYALGKQESGRISRTQRTVPKMENGFINLPRTQLTEKRWMD